MKNIVLIGYRGTGKTTVGRLLAARLGREFLDTDALVVERAGKTIKAIFEEEGEEAFRALESAVVREAAGHRGAVIATGGGAVLRAENVRALKAGGKVIWLRGDAETLHARIAADAATGLQRPRLMGGGGGSAGHLEEVRALLAVREPLYEGAADGTISVVDISIEEIVGGIAGMAVKENRGVNGIGMWGV